MENDAANRQANGLLAKRPVKVSMTQQSPKRFIVKSRPMGLRPGIDPLKLSKLADDLETEAFLDSTRRLNAYIAANSKRKKR